MKPLALAAVFTLLPTAAWAGSFMATVSGGGLRVTATGKLAIPVAAASLVILSGSRSLGDLRFEGPTYLIVDATPLAAQVFLDGRLLGLAHQLVARAFPLSPGGHAIEIVAPGFRPYIARFTVASGSFPARFRVALSPE